MAYKNFGRIWIEVDESDENGNRIPIDKLFQLAMIKINNSEDPDLKSKKRIAYNNKAKSTLVLIPIKDKKDPKKLRFERSKMRICIGYEDHICNREISDRRYSHSSKGLRCPECKIWHDKQRKRRHWLRNRDRYKHGYRLSRHRHLISKKPRLGNPKQDQEVLKIVRKNRKMNY